MSRYFTRYLQTLKLLEINVCSISYQLEGTAWSVSVGILFDLRSPTEVICDFCKSVVGAILTLNHAGLTVLII